MQATEFTTIVQNRTIQVPAPENLPEGAIVRVLVLSEPQEPDADGNMEANFEAWDALLSAIPESKER
ncbi:hypothetical protein LepocDRAFT_00004460 [Leptothrix ochracea L12]|uniref:Uncharacterized protein n=1 Tax=Leptothrix ochracea L12 TaxID=735332 RepID=I4Z664_9BURK|nr:hypothetical protein [Leptothrix ochracea]EIM31706.1 hypothetical protein LepocDRAFT_00004460 [Leptothrix ochracea L12]